MQEAARVKGVLLHIVKAGSESEIDAAFAELHQERSSRTRLAKTEFAGDSPLEGTGFELLVRGRGEAGLSAF
jgi:hypothetical protein